MTTKERWLRRIIEELEKEQKIRMSLRLALVENNKCIERLVEMVENVDTHVAEIERKILQKKKM